MSFGLRVALALAAFVTLLLVVLTFEFPPVDTNQIGFRGLAMEQVKNPRAAAAKIEANQAPEPQPAVGPGSPNVTTVYKNVQVLTDVNVAEFTRLMTAITAWVAPPDQQCNYCHAQGKDLSDDSVYTKVVARRMLQMTRHINNDWKNHVADTGVTCFTCHRGQPVPQQVWFADPGPKGASGIVGTRAGQNYPAPSVAFASLPFDPFSPHLGDKGAIRVLGKEALPHGGSSASIQATERTYGLMMHFSNALGENCTYCHNTRSFASWEGPPQRATAWYGIRMVRDLNVNYLEPLAPKYPADRLGPLGDAAKANCATCHQGVHKPLYGASMLQHYPELRGTPSGKPPAAQLPIAQPATAQQPTAQQPTAQQPTAQPPTPEPVLVGEVVVVYFAVASTALHDAAPKLLEALAARLKANPAAKATISGYHSATGDAAQNHELARGRAVAVRDALKSAGVAEDRVVLEKPTAERANIAGEDPQARRVEVKVN